MVYQVAGWSAVGAERPASRRACAVREHAAVPRLAPAGLATGGEPVGTTGAATAAAAAVDAAGPPLVPLSSVTPITDDDYFARNAEFSSWLRDTQRTFFRRAGERWASERESKRAPSLGLRTAAASERGLGSLERQAASPSAGAPAGTAGPRRGAAPCTGCPT